jgi:uncharacterized membrane protein
MATDSTTLSEAPPAATAPGTTPTLGGYETREIFPADVTAAFAAGWKDLTRAPGFSLPFGVFYALAGLLIVYLLLLRGEEYLVFPTISMFLLVGPITAVGLYEISRRLEAGERLTFAGVAGAFRRHGGLQIGVFGVILFFCALFWAKTAAFIYALHFGLHPVPVTQILTAVTTTLGGLQFFVIGTAVGALFAGIVFSISVVAVPMLLDRDVDPVTAIVTSLTAVAQSPMSFLGFAAMVVLLIGVGIGTFFLGLIVTLPMVGHATWHLYRKVVVVPADDETPAA